MTTRARIAREYKDLVDSGEFDIRKKEDSMDLFTVTICGPDSSPYKGIHFVLNSDVSL